MTDKIVLKRFSLELERWGKDKGKYTCEIAMSVGEHSMSFLLPSEVGDKVVTLCGEVLYGESVKCADHIASVFEQIVGEEKAISWDDPESHVPFIDGAKL